MKNKLLIIVSIIFFVGGIFAGGNAWLDNQNVQAETKTESENTISVTGKGEIKVNPDVAYIRLGIETEGKTAQEAQSKNAKLFEEVKKALNKHGIKEKDIQTKRFDLSPRYDYTNDKQELRGYGLQHIMEVTYRSIDEIGPLLDDLSKAGVNRVEGMRFATEKETDYEIKALQLALKNARLKAKAIAEAEGKQIRDIIYISENGDPYTPVFNESFSLAADRAEKVAAPQTGIYSGELTISKNVRVLYTY